MQEPCKITLSTSTWRACSVEGWGELSDFNKIQGMYQIFFGFFILFFGMKWPDMTMLIEVTLLVYYVGSEANVRFV